MDNYINQQPNWGPIGYVTYKRTYARPIESENRTEEWWETVRRVVEGTYSIQKDYCKKLKLPWNDNKAQKSAQEMFRYIWDMKFLPPGRGLWMMGTPYVFEKGSAALNNCAFTSTDQLHVDFAAPFCFLMDMSMLGVGVGGNTAGAGTVKIKAPHQGHDVHVVEDSREGWVELVRRHLLAYVGKASLPVSVDYSLVREYGAPIKGFGGTSSGPQPLKELLENIHSILSPLIEQDITSDAITDLFNAIGKCVVSGNVRRSAEIMLGNYNDDVFLSLKDPTVNKDKLWNYRWASNNSIYADVGMDYTKIADMISKNGEPGAFWLDTVRKFGRLKDPINNKDRRVIGTNPCSEQSLENMELCCLVETFPARCDSYEEYERVLKFAYLYAKTVTLLPTHNERTNAVMLRNRRIGTSQSGIVQNFNKIGLRNHFKWCDQGYNYLQTLDEVYSDWLCIPKSIKMTSVKPSGTVSLLPGATPGIHFPQAEYYWRTIRMDSGSKLATALREAGYKVVDLPNEGYKTCVVYFPVKEENFYKSLADVSMWEQLEIAAQMQYYWADNQVSVTITFKEHEASQIKQALELYETRLKSVSFLPYTTHGYEHAPYQPITKEEYEEAKKDLKPIKLINSVETEGYSKTFCDADGVCAIPEKA
jgi:adenosylcobalamin-dependent ribonucleoside-triphosphate reductase